MPTPPFKPLDFTLAYQFAECTLRAIEDPEAVGIEGTEGDFLGWGEPAFFDKISKPHKCTLLHDFVRNLNYFAMDWQTGHLDPCDLIAMYTAPLTAAGIEIPAWFNEAELDDHTTELDILLGELSLAATESAFYILFGDRDFLFKFSCFVSTFVGEQDMTDSQVMRKKGVVKRLGYTPAWLSKAVFHRDKGRCQICTTDLTGLIIPASNIHLDHMLPLQISGTNDPTNFQLLCEKCNTSKGKKAIVKKHHIYTYW